MTQNLTSEQDVIDRAASVHDKRTPSEAQSFSLRKPSENFKLLQTPSSTVNGQINQELKRQIEASNDNQVS